MGNTKMPQWEFQGLLKTLGFPFSPSSRLKGSADGHFNPLKGRDLALQYMQNKPEQVLTERIVLVETISAALTPRHINSCQ